MNEHFNEAAHYFIAADNEGGKHIIVEQTEFVRKNARWSFGKKSGSRRASLQDRRWGVLDSA